ncbi:hypothetical protein M9H77_06480 [Catharanthus roseus]|uniref:Uncharacterized protein n=1 Tax=Catharanthus roseus TaxID=4058 RepID=A0ACC0BS73_CATRO|nr:hypothetical protein M9H77_06480 [Catharanthus roseus]
MVEESPKIKELSQAKIEESLKIHVEDESSKEEPCCITMRRALKLKKIERMEEKQVFKDKDNVKQRFMESLMVEKSPKIKEPSQATIEESLKIHVEDESSKEEPCCIMNEKSIEIKQKERVEEKE